MVLVIALIAQLVTNKGINQLPAAKTGLYESNTRAFSDPQHGQPRVCCS